MAFTDVETAQAHQAAFADPTGEDLCKLGILYSTEQGGEIDYVGELVGRGNLGRVSRDRPAQASLPRHQSRL